MILLDTDVAIDILRGHPPLSPGCKGLAPPQWECRG